MKIKKEALLNYLIIGLLILGFLFMGKLGAYSGNATNEVSCVDNDKDNIFTKGTVSFNGKRYIDSCVSGYFSTSVVEYTCDGNKMKSKTIKCPDNRLCRYGACKQNPKKIKCVDSDGENVNIKGKVTIGGKDYFDSCGDDLTITEQVCDKDGNNRPIRKNLRLKCSTGERCVDGACENLCKKEYETSGKWKILGPFNGRVDAIEFNAESKELFVGTHGSGVFKSSNGGKTWDWFSKGITAETITFLKFVNGTLYLGTDEGGVYRLVNGNWEIVMDVLQNDKLTTFYSIVYDSKSNGIFLSGNDKLFYSYNNGLTWDSIKLSEEYYGPISSIYLDNKTDIFFAATSSGLYKSEDRGKNWYKTSLDGFIRGIVMEDNNLYVTEYGTGLYKSSDLGDSFVKINDLRQKVFDYDNNTIQMSSNGLIFFNKDKLYTGGDYIYSSSNFGENFVVLRSPLKSDCKAWDGTPPMPEPCPYHVDIRNIFFDNINNRILIATDGGIYQSIDEGLTWEILGKLPNTELGSILVAPSGLFSGVIDWGGFKTDDCGKSWEHDNWDEEGYYRQDPKNDKIIFYRGTFSTYVSLDGGNYLNLLLSEGIRPFGETIAFDTSEKITKTYITAGNNIYRINNFDNLLDMKSSIVKIPFDKEPEFIATDPKDIRNLYVATYSEVFKSFNSGINWQQIFFDYSSSFYNININPYTGDIYIPATEGKLFKIDKEQKVNKINLPFDFSKKINNDVRVVAFDDLNSSWIYVGTEQGFFYSKDNGKTWNLFNEGLYTEKIRDIQAHKDYIFVATFGSGAGVISKKDLE